MKPAFTTEEEKVFFENLLVLEERIIQTGLRLKLIDKAPPSQRFKRIHVGILPLMKQAKQLTQNPETETLVKDLKQWDQLRTELIQRNLGLMTLAVRKTRDSSQHEYLINDLLPKLNQAFEFFEPKRGFKFSTYATLALIREVKRSVAQQFVMNITNLYSHNWAQRVQQLNQDRFDRGLPDMTVEEIAAELKISVFRAKKLLGLSQVRMINLDKEISLHSSVDQQDLIPAPQYTSESTFDRAESRLVVLNELIGKITNTRIQQIMRLKNQGKGFIEISQSFEDRTFSKQAMQLKYEDGILALRAIMAIESGAVTAPEDIDLLTSYYGLYGIQKRALHLIASDRNLKKVDILARISFLTKGVEEEHLDRIVDQKKKQR